MSLEVYNQFWGYWECDIMSQGNFLQYIDGYIVNKSSGTKLYCGKETSSGLGGIGIKWFQGVRVTEF